MTYPPYPNPPNGPGGEGWQQPGNPYLTPEQAQQFWAQQQYPTGPGGPPMWNQPGYGYPPPPPPPPKKPRLGLGARIGLIVLAVLVVGAIGDAGSDAETTEAADSTPAVRQPADAAAPARPAPPAEPEIPDFAGAREGDVAGAPDSPLRVDDVMLSATALTKGDSTFSQTLCTRVSYRNGSAESISYGPFDWSLQNPRGSIVSLTFFGGADSQLSSGELAPNGTVEGDMCFEDENASKGDYVLLYDPPSFFTQERAAWINPR